MIQINYYDELNISPDLSIDQIRVELTKLERVWHQREINQPEKARKMLTLIDEAYEIFKSENDKKNYDVQFNSKHITSEKNNEFIKWYNQALEFFNNEQFDLAKVAIEKAEKYYDEESEDDSFLTNTADIYRYNKDFRKALKLINEAIVINPKNPLNYLIKATIFYETENYVDACEWYKRASKIAHNNSDKKSESQAQGFLCSVLFYALKDYSSAEIAARNAIELGDVSGFGNKILNELERPIDIDSTDIRKVLREYQRESCIIEEKINEKIKMVLSNIQELGAQYYVISKKKMEKTYPSDDIRYFCRCQIVIESSGLWCMYIKKEMSSEATRRSYGSEEQKIPYSRYPVIPNTILREFDFEGSVFFSDRHTQGIIDDIEIFDSMPLPYKRTKLTRLFIKKGTGLLNRLDDVLKEQELLIEKKRAEEKLCIERASIINKWKSENRCQHCGGDFKGIFTKKCINCGNEKDY